MVSAPDEDAHRAVVSAPDEDADCAVVFTSGATGPPKGVVYRRGQLRRQIDVLVQTYGVTPGDRLVAAFAPFALYGPALGIASTVPDVDVTAPATLTAAALADAVASIDATLVFASPAALTNVIATAPELTEGQRSILRDPRLVLSAGAPLPLTLVWQVARLLPGADVRTPYGMTEVLPVTDVSLRELETAGDGRGVCVGRAVPGVTIAVLPLVGDDADRPGHGAGPVELIDVTGEVCVAAAHGKDHYDRLWATEAESSRYRGWHRTGDVGHLDHAGRLWIEGRRDDVVRTAAGPVTPVPVEQCVQAGADVRAAAIVGIGPVGARQLVAVVVGPDAPASHQRQPRHPLRPRARSRPRSASRRLRMQVAGLDLSDRVRAAAGVPIAAVLITAALPVDIRHNSKVDHPALARAAERVLAGHGGPDRVHRP